MSATRKGMVARIDALHAGRSGALRVARSLRNPGETFELYPIDHNGARITIPIATRSHYTWGVIYTLPTPEQIADDVLNNHGCNGPEADEVVSSTGATWRSMLIEAVKEARA